MMTTGIAIALIVALLAIAITLLCIIWYKDRQQHSLQKDLEDALAAAQSANEAKSRFLAGVSHDIRTPCSAVIGLTEIAQHYADDPQHVRECLEKIERSSHHLLGLINDVLDVSKIESGQLLLVDEPFSLQRLLSDVEVIVHPQAVSKELSFTMVVETQACDWLCGDALHLKQVLLNLVDNAVKYTEPGGFVKLTVSKKDGNAAPTAPALFCFEVSDNGIGMAPEFIGRVFEPFEREQVVETRHIEGTGLGMSIVKNVIDHMGGTISLCSARHQGTTFTVMLPLTVRTLDGYQSHNETIERRLRRDFTGVRVLLAEDDEINAEIVCEHIGRAHAKVDWAHDGKEAVALALAAPPSRYHLIFMDVQMPRMDGLSASRTLCGVRDRDGRAIPPIIALTANAYVEDRHRAREAGMVDYLVKPISFEDVCRVLDGYVPRSEASPRDCQVDERETMFATSSGDDLL